MNQNLFRKLIDEYVNHLKTFICTVPSNTVLFLPRNTKDNYVRNDRTIPDSQNIEDGVISIGGSVLNTYQINNLNLQFSIINSFKTINLDFGSSFLVNCIFLSGKTIIIIGGPMSQINDFISINIIYSIIAANNKVIVVGSNFDQIKQIFV